MKIENLAKMVQNEVKDLNVGTENIISAMVKLLEIIHANGLDSQAVEALQECGITLEIEEE